MNPKHLAYGLLGLAGICLVASLIVSSWAMDCYPACDDITAVVQIINTPILVTLAASLISSAILFTRGRVEGEASTEPGQASG